MQSCNRRDYKPEHIMSLAVVSRRLGVSRSTLEKYIRRGVIEPDFQSEMGVHFRAPQLAAIRTIINQNRALRRKHCSSAGASI
jgi:predicted site-specific integrase-resolvase